MVYYQHGKVCPGVVLLKALRKDRRIRKLCARARRASVQDGAGSAILKVTLL
jgi:hypothetical protein